MGDYDVFDELDGGDEAAEDLTGRFSGSATRDSRRAIEALLEERRLRRLLDEELDF